MREEDCAIFCWTPRGFRGDDSGVRDVACLGAAAALFSLFCACGGAGGTAGSGSIAPGGDDAGAKVPSGDDGGAPDVGVDGPQRPDCSRGAQTRTAPASLFDAYVSDVATMATRADRDARTTKLIADVGARGGAPLEDPAGDRVVFLVRGAPPQGTWNVAGSFGGWKSNPVAMHNVAGTDLWFADTHVARGRAEQYKLWNGSDDTGFAQDMLARNVAWDGVDRGAPGEFNAIVHAGDGDVAKGRILAWRGVHSQKLGDDRDVFVYVPARYDDGSCVALPAIVFHDGNESLTRGDFAGAADAEYAAHPDESAILAFVALANQDVRIDEYTFGTSTALAEAYGEFLANEIAPRLDASLRTCGAHARGIAGASLGGLVSVYLAFQRSDVWTFVGAQSPSLFWQNDAMIARASQDPVVAVRFYLDNGIPGGSCADDDNCAVTQRMNDALAAKGYDVLHVTAADAQHDWPYWRARIPQLLAFFRKGKSGCE